MLSTGADALLTIDGRLESGEAALGVDGTQKDGLKLIHTGIGEE